METRSNQKNKPQKHLPAALPLRPHHASVGSSSDESNKRHYLLATNDHCVLPSFHPQSSIPSPYPRPALADAHNSTQKSPYSRLIPHNPASWAGGEGGYEMAKFAHHSAAGYPQSNQIKPKKLFRPSVIRSSAFDLGHSMFSACFATGQTWSNPVQPKIQPGPALRLPPPANPASGILYRASANPCN